MPLERFRFRAMGSPCELQLHAPSRATAAETARACGQEIDRLERKFSRYRPDSLATRINDSAGDARGVEVDDETAALLDFADAAHRESGGLFDPTSGVLRRVWDFKSGRLPAPEALRRVRGLVGWRRLRWERPRLVLPEPGMELDFGGFVKEYAADRVAELCRDRGVRSGLVSLGGDIAIVGPQPDGEPWRVGIRDPRAPDRAIARIALERGGLATSGDYERFMIVDGRRYSHLLDPRSGESHRGGPACVSVTAPHCLVAGVSSTIAMLHPERDVADFLEGLGLPWLVVFQSGRVTGTTRLVETRGAPIDRTPSRDRSTVPAPPLRSA
jgi:thiamine biosynthesis lipoprotein